MALIKKKKQYVCVCVVYVFDVLEEYIKHQYMDNFLNLA